MDSTSKSSQRSYGLGTLLRVFGNSRSTIRYYEKLGIIEPQSDIGTVRKSYSEADIYSIVECSMLKNAGYSLQEATELLADPANSDNDILRAALRTSERQRLWYEGVSWALAWAAALRSDASLRTPRLVSAYEWLLFFDNCEEGYDDFAPVESYEVRQALLDAVPITSFGITEHYRSQQPPQRGLAIPKQYLSLISELDGADLTPCELGGCPCIALVRDIHLEGVHDPAYRTDADDSMMDALERFADSNGLAISGPLFSVGTIPLRGVFSVETFAPVEAANSRGRRALARLRRSGKE